MVNPKYVWEPYSIIIKRVTWEFLLFFGLLILFLKTAITYLVDFKIDKYKYPPNIAQNINLTPITALIILIFSCLAIAYYLAIKKNSRKIKIIVIACILLIQALILTGQIYKRFSSDNAWWQPHDGNTQTEVAMDFFLQGKNPYQTNYYDTALDNQRDRISRWYILNKKWVMINPALENYVYMPLNFILPLPFKYMFTKILSFYDNRIFSFLFYLLSCLLIYKLPQDAKKKNILLIFFSLNYLTFTDMIFGYSDIVLTYFLLLAYYFLKKERYVGSIIAISIAGLIKQNMIFFWPFFLAYIFIKKNIHFNKQSLPQFYKYPLIMLLLAIIVLLPFILWCPNCFYHDTIYYLGHIYPARGLGLAGLLLWLKIISSPFQYYNFALWQILFLIISLPLLLRRQYKNNTPRNVLLNGIILMTGVWFLSRYFTDAHFNFVISNLMIILLL